MIAINERKIEVSEELKNELKKRIYDACKNDISHTKNLAIL
jgi:hypothetical protein